jgi:hypothetical protein
MVGCGHRVLGSRDSGGWVVAPGVVGSNVAWRLRTYTESAARWAHETSLSIALTFSNGRNNEEHSLASGQMTCFGGCCTEGA